MSKRLLASLLVAGLVFCTSFAFAYVPSRTNRSSTPLTWNNTNRVFMTPNSTGSDDIDGDNTHIRAIERAAQNWNTAANDVSHMKLEITESKSGIGLGFTQEGCNENVVVFVEKEWPHARDAGGLTTVSFIDDPESEEDGRILDADVELNGEFFSFSIGGDNGTTDLENVLTHEFGHVLGIDHPCYFQVADGESPPLDNEGNEIPQCFPKDELDPEIPELTMFNTAEPGETKKRTPEDGDVLALAETYPIAQDPGAGELVCFSGDGEDGGGGGCVTTAPSNSTGLALLSALALGLFIRRRRASR